MAALIGLTVQDTGPPVFGCLQIRLIRFFSLISIINYSIIWATVESKAKDRVFGW